MVPGCSRVLITCLKRDDRTKERREEGKTGGRKDGRKETRVLLFCIAS